MTFRYGIVGAGMVSGVFHRAAAADDGFEITGVHARAADSRARAATEHGVEVFATLEALLGSDINALIVTTPPNARDAIIRACAKVRMPVLTEKPLERTADAARALVTHMGPTPFGIVLQHRMRAASQAARDLIAGKTVGAVRMLRIDVPWWRDPSYYAEPGRGTYARDGGGVMLTQAIHALDLGLWLAGTPVTQVRGQTFRAIHKLEAEDTAVAALTFESGAAGVFTATTAGFPGAPETVEVTCEHATLRLNAGQLTVLHRDGRTETAGDPSGTGSGADPMAFPHDPHQAVMSDFAQAVTDRRVPAIPAASALPVHRVIDAITTSSREGRVVDISPGTGRREKTQGVLS